MHRERRLKKKYFGTDGIRGKANGALNPELALKIGQAAGTFFKRGDYRHRVVLGKDTRLSGYMLEAALVSGLTSVGVDVLQLGPIPTPAVAMLTRSMRADLGVMISASHNPYEDNGIKLFGPDGYKLVDHVEQKIESFLEGKIPLPLAKSSEIGRARRIAGVNARYIEFAKRSLRKDLSLEGMRIVVDCAHGAGYHVAPETLWELGAEVIAIGVAPDGFNINQHYGATSPQNLIDKVHERRADIGIALDGDADRILIIDEKGKIVDGDQVMAAIALFWKEEGLLSRPGVVSTIMSNLGLERFLKQYDLELIRTNVGDRNVLEVMRQGGYNLGGEKSGHILLTDYTTSGDGLIAALQILSIIKKQNKPVSEVCQCFTSLPQIIKSIEVNATQALKKKSVVKAIDEARAVLGNEGRLIVRPSGTESVIRIMAEGNDHNLIHSIVEQIETSMRENAY